MLSAGDCAGFAVTMPSQGEQNDHYPLERMTAFFNEKT
jgi:hypothetical protein